MSATKVGRVISRLAVVAKDFSTYYIPGHTMVGDNQVWNIDEQDGEYVIYGEDMLVLAKISKSAPVLVDYTGLFEVPDPAYIEQITPELVNFGNFLFDKYGVAVMSDDGTNKPLYGRKVTDADLRNWIDSLIPKP